MDTSKFELTEEELIRINNKYVGSSMAAQIATAKAQVAKFYSILEPVELEVMGGEEINSHARIYGIYSNTAKDLCREITQTTIQKNQKGQLFRLKEEE